ncbi:MAG: hypothetical protein BRD50_06785, partial [Bacteroidetes bacterium SW_11_45_7]
NITPDSGTVAAGDSVSVDFTFDGTDLIAGQYPGTIFIQSNYPDSSNYLLPTLLTINVPHAIGLSDTVLDLGSHLIGSTHKDTFTISNPVCDTLAVTDINTTDNVYNVNDTSFSILPYDSQRVVLAFTPAEVKSYDDTLTIFSTAGDTSVNLQGTGLVSPDIAVSPDTLNGSIASCNDSVTETFTIYNEGDSTLTWEARKGKSISDDFDPAIDNSIWSSMNGVSSETYCGANSGTNHLWFGGSSGIRQISTIDLNTLRGGTIELYLKATTSGTNCESPGASDEYMLLQYSNDGGTSWADINTYTYNNFDGVYGLVSEQIPAAAQTSSTRFRIRQFDYSI